MSSYHRSSSPSSSSDGRSSDCESSSRGAYVPLHRRSPPSSVTSVSEPSSSRSSSPSKRRDETKKPTASPRIYTIGYLLSLRPFATHGLKEQMRATCSEVVMNRRMRKGIEFSANQARSAEKALLAQQRALQQQQDQEQARLQWQQRVSYPIQPPTTSGPTSSPRGISMITHNQQPTRLPARSPESRKENAVRRNATNRSNSNPSLIAA